MNVRFDPAATAELEEAAQWYEAQRVALRQEFLAEFQIGIQQITERPRAWQCVGPDVRRYRLGRFPYGIVYMLGDDRIIVVLAIAHLRRKLGYWKPRLKKNR